MCKLRIPLPALLIIPLIALFAYAGTAGSFRGKVVQNEQTTDPKWIYIQGRNGMVRRVEISHARIEYDQDVPAANRKAKPQQSLTSGTEVRVTAEQGSDGEWRASRVEILSTANDSAAKEEKGKT
jgi:hypothetical protein